MAATARGLASLPLVALLVSLVAVPGVASTSVSGTPLHLLGRIDRKAGTPAGYDRALFVHWIDADGDGCDTRREVLIAESVAPLSIGSGCSFTGGRWKSAYDTTTTTDSSSFDVDHMVPLKEAWDSGARAWTANRRRAFANDLGDWRSLRAVSASSNRSKSDRDPAEWLPRRSSSHCTYASQWVAVKVRWRLTADRAEKRAIRGILGGCPTTKVRVKVR